MPPSALMPRATCREHRLAWPVAQSRHCPQGFEGQGATRAPTATPDAGPGLGDHADHLMAQGDRRRATVDRVGPDGHRDRPVADLVDVRAADGGRLDPHEDLSGAGRRHRHLVEADVVAGVPADGSHAACQPISAWRTSASSMSSSAMRRWTASNGTSGRRRAAPAKIPWRTASNFRNWFEMSIC